MHSSTDAGDPQHTQDSSDAALPRAKRSYVAGRGFETAEQLKKRRQEEDEAWAAMCGPVTVRYKEGYDPDGRTD